MNCCCSDIPYFDCKNIETLEQFINRLIQLAKDRYGLDILDFVPLMTQTKELSLGDYGKDIFWSTKQGKKFEVVCFLEIGVNIFLFSKDGFEQRELRNMVFDSFLHQMEERNRKVEMDDWREKLIAVGINPEW